MAQPLGPFGEKDSLGFNGGIRLHRGPQTSWEQVGRNLKDDPRKVSFELHSHPYFHFRTDNAIKNHFYSTLRKLISRI